MNKTGFENHEFNPIQNAVTIRNTMLQVEGFVAVKLRVPGKNYVVCCGFNVGRNRWNAAGLQIRAEDGVGNITGHGVNPTGKVTDVGDLAKQVKGIVHNFFYFRSELIF